jgi:outer membrane receptor protein involved in Fe transport
LDHGHSPTADSLAGLGLETDFYRSQLLILKLVTATVTPATTITAAAAIIAAATVTAAITAAATVTAAAAIAAAITAAVTAAAITAATTVTAVAIAAAITATIDTARRRSTAGRRRRRSIDLAAAAPVGDGSTGDDWNTGNREVGCFGLGGNGGGSEREDRRGHDGYPA